MAGKNARRSLPQHFLVLCLVTMFIIVIERPAGIEDKKSSQRNHLSENMTSLDASHQVVSTTADNMTISTISEFDPSYPKVFLCGFDFWNFYDGVFGDFEFGGQLVNPGKSNAADILLYVGLDGPCDVSQEDIRQQFAGKVLFVNTEPRKGEAAEKQRLSERFYKIGPSEDPIEPRTLPVYFGAMFWYAITTLEQRALFWESAEARKQRLRNEPERRAAVAFLVSNCVAFRREAADRISEFIEVHHSSKCGPTNSNNARRIPKQDQTGRSDYFENYKLYSKYKFCLVMENTDTSGYITEKIILAYLGGCIPIFWGAKDVIEVFDTDSFVYYDVHDPEAALFQLRELQSNLTKWENKRNAPILAHGMDTLYNHFSFDDTIGGGHLKREIRRMMGMEGKP